ncbi:MAG: hypothetical protein EHM19_12915 [Candidatus Latescibacterota bacterium]|nr:MAG: hypothetical protein EHM19_12915 [Candidatus Latescibacterota bacterium]
MQWTAPGDDGDSGTAALYDIRYAAASETASAWWDSTAIPVEGEPGPGLPGRRQEYTIAGLDTTATYRIGLETVDDCGNRSPLSNVLVAATPEPHAIPPHILAGTVSPDWGDTSDVFLFSIWYGDWDDDPPGMHAVVIDGENRSMDEFEPILVGYFRYEYATMLPAGTHAFHFEFDDGFGHATRLPIEGSFEGPAVVAASLDSTALAATPGLRPQSASWSPDGGSVVFFALGSGDRPSGVYRIEVGGHEPVLVHECEDTCEPAWSPDGSSIAFERTVSGRRHIWTVPASGGSPVPITTGETLDFSPTWSPDGARIAYSSFPVDGSPLSQTLWTVPSDGGDPTDIGNRGRSPAWSPGGGKIAFVQAYEEFVGIFWALSTGSRVHRVATGTFWVGQPTWSPDESRLAFLTDEALATASADGGPIETILAWPPSAPLRSPDWSPDGARILYVREGEEAIRFASVD